ncbi:hypothetical protein HZA99_03145 [Candidatus Woesearchaeota archaeon]|nr:hypothetical protein [Candidatus Woesearchaeota archaeon]
MSESQGKTSKVSTWNGLATKIPQEGYEMEAWNEITAYQRLETAGCNTGLIKIKSMDENKRVIFMEDYTTRGGMTLEECIAGELGINLPDKKDKRVSAIEQLLPNHTFTKDEVRKRAQIVLGLLNATEAYAPHNISENDISNTNVIVYRDGSITLLDFNKAIEVKEKAGKKEFGHLVALDLKRPQDSHYRVVGGILINMYWTHHEMADATKRDQAIYSARMDIDDVMRHHDYHMIMSLVYWSITGNRWTKEAKQGEKIDSTILKDYLQKNNLKEYLK